MSRHVPRAVKMGHASRAGAEVRDVSRSLTRTTGTLQKNTALSEHTIRAVTFPQAALQLPSTGFAIFISGEDGKLSTWAADVMQEKNAPYVLAKLKEYVANLERLHGEYLMREKAKAIPQ